MNKEGVAGAPAGSGASEEAPARGRLPPP